MEWELNEYPRPNGTTEVELEYTDADDLPLSKLADEIMTELEKTGVSPNEVMVRALELKWSRPWNDDERKRMEEMNKMQGDRYYASAKMWTDKLKEMYGNDPSQWPGM